MSSLAASAFAFDGNLMDDTTLGWANSVRSSGAGMIAFGTISGGAGASLTGGNFWQGAVTGLIVSGLNHYVHNQRGESEDDFVTEDGNDQEEPPTKKPSLEDLKKNPPKHPDYKAPKSGDRKVNHPRGKGWIDKDGRVWIPDDHGGTHAPHWDVQPKKGPGYETKYPMSLVTPKNVAAGYIIYKVVVALATWECFGCGVLVTP